MVRPLREEEIMNLGPILRPWRVNISKVKGEMKFPRMFHIRQVFNVPKIANIEEALRRELESIQIRTCVKEGSRSGSSGIVNMDRILRFTAQFLKESRAKPFLFPAMVSHEGGTAEGQL